MRFTICASASESTDVSNVSNITVLSNVWVDSENPEGTALHQAVDQIPGDLMVDIIAAENPSINPRDQRILKARLNRRQMKEYLVRRFFLNNGETGAAYQES